MRRPIGETAGSAYRGDRGKIAYDHSQSAHAPAGAQANSIESITLNGTPLTITAKGVSVPGLANAALVSALEGLSYSVTYELSGGTNDPSNPATFIVSDLPIALLPATKAGNVFGGWFAEVGLTTPVAEIATLGNKTVYAKFTEEVER